jgi:hypothetical protein
MNAQPASAAETVLTAKWSRTSMGTNWEGGLVIGDVTGDNAEDIVYAGGGNDIIQVLNGATGATIATYTNTRISQYCQPQLYDVNGDGILDILVPLYSRPGLAVVTYDGDSTLSALWVRDTQGTGGSGSCMSKPVAGDINGDGHPEIYIACQDVSPAYNFNNATGVPVPTPDGYDGTVTMFDYQGNIVAQNFNWRSCSGGLSLADTDNDGEFELYMGDRGMYYGDGNYGKGTIAYWARNMSIIWQRLDFLSSSQAPVLVDINGDGVLDVLSGMYRETNIQNSSNGAIMQKWSGGSINVMSVHYGITVCDIDGDGHQELLCNDGDHDDDAYADVIDLVTGQLDAQLSLAGGDTKWSPTVADISPTQSGMEIICVPNGTTLETGYWRGAIMIFNRNFESIQNVSRFNGNTMGSQLAYPIIQDIDGDGLLELVTHSSSGTIYAFDTQAPKPAQRIRSEVTFYGEQRTGVAQYSIPPWGTNYWVAPIVASVSPANDALNVPITTTTLSFNMREHQGQNVNYTVTTMPDIGNASGSSIGNSYNWATYNVGINSSRLNYDTTYSWTVKATDGTYNTTKTYTFHTALAPAAAGNTAPTQATPTLISTDNKNTTTSTFVAANQTTTDPNGDPVANTYRWLVNGVPVANLQLPFNLRSGTSTKDYAYGNNGIVKGATWVPNGIIGGAYSFDGQNDVIMISDGGKGYFDNKTYTDNQAELGGGGNWTQLTVEAWINLKAYNTGSRIIAKVPSYEIGFSSANTLVASVWTKTGVINYNDDNHASSDRAQTVTAPVNLQLNTWYHIAFTYKSGEGVKLYLNGQQVGQRAGVSGPLESSYGEPVYIGRLVEPFNGLIDEVSIYQYAQTAQQIANSYQNTVSGTSSNAKFIPIDVAKKGDTLSCQVIPTDSYLEGFTSVSNGIILNNNPPVANNLLTYPLHDRAYRLDTENLVANYTYYDADNDTELGTQIRWYMNGALQSQYNDSKQVPASATSLGQTWYFTVSPRDLPGDFGDLQTSSPVTIRSNIAPSTGTPVLDSTDGGTDYDDEDLIATAQGTTDPNGDKTTNIYHWTRNGVSTTNLQLPFDTEVPSVLGLKGATRDYSGYGNNGSVTGATWVQNGVVGGALRFDGNDYVSVQERSNSLGGDGSWSTISVEFWIKADGSTTSTQTVVFKPDSTYAPGTTSYSTGYRVQYRYYADSYRVYWIVGNNTASLSLNTRIYEGSTQWHHIVCTYQTGVGLKIYTDGTLRTSMAATGNINATTGGSLYLGGVGSTSGDFSGLLDEVRIYPTVLSPAQIFQRYIETKDGSSSNTIVPSETSSGDNWICQVIPNDSWDDGAAVNSAVLNVAARNTQPHIDWYSPANTTIQITAGNTVALQQVPSDPNNDTLTYAWTLDSVLQATTQNWAYTPATNATGTHNVRVTVSDGTLSDYQDWTILVLNNETRKLEILPSSNGATNPATGNYTYTANSTVQIQALPNSGYQLSYWLRNGTNVGNATLINLIMDDNYNLSAVYIQVPQVNLHVQYGGEGTTNPAGDTICNLGSTVSVQATPSAGWAFSYWLLNGTNVGTTNPYQCLMDANYNLTAVFTQPPETFNLTINTTGDGTVNKNPNQATYTYGTNVTLTATPTSGASFLGWSGDASGTELSITINMTSNKAVTATFSTTTPQSIIVFEDDFESGTFNAWSSTTRTTGETTTIASNIVHAGTYSACFTTSGNGGYERAYASRSGLNLGEVYARVYVYVDQSGIVDNGDRSYFVQLMSGGNALAYGGWRQDSSGNLHWHIMIRDGTNTVGAYSTIVPAADNWYLVELHWKADATTGIGELYVDGTLVASIADRNTSNYGNMTLARIGLPEVYNCAATTVYVDDVTISTAQETEPPEPEFVYLIIGSSPNGTTNPAAGAYPYTKDSTVTVSASPNSGYTLTGWLFDGIQIPAATDQIEITMNATHGITPIFTEISTTYYTLTVGTTGQGTTNPTGTNDYLSSSNVPVQATPSSGWKLDYWLLNTTNVGSTNPYIVNMNGNYTLTAVFVEEPEPPTAILSDGFETGDFSLWTTTSSTSGETATVTTNPIYAGNNAALFTSNGGGSYEKAYASKTLSTSLGEVYVQTTFKLTQNGLVENGDRVKLIELRVGSTILGSAGLTMRSGTLRWWMETRDGTSYIETYAQSTTDFSNWVTLELQWINSANNGGGTIFVNGAPVIQVGGDNTSNYGNASEVRVGLPEVYNCGATVLSMDNVVIDDQDIP